MVRIILNKLMADTKSSSTTDSATGGCPVAHEEGGCPASVEMNPTNMVRCVGVCMCANMNCVDTSSTESGASTRSAIRAIQRERNIQYPQR